MFETNVCIAVKDSSLTQKASTKTMKPKTIKMFHTKLNAPGIAMETRCEAEQRVGMESPVYKTILF